jgi:hypothetical protein
MRNPLWMYDLLIIVSVIVLFTMISMIAIEFFGV